MSVFHHQQIQGSDVCVHCLDEWPCQMGRARIEMAERIREVRVTPTWDPAYDSGRETGLELAAELIERI